MRRIALRALRRVLRQIDVWLDGAVVPSGAAAPVDAEQLLRCRRGLEDLELDANAREYLGVHIDRLARTLTLVPPPGAHSRVLELGCYMQMTPLLASEIGYREVRGAYLGAKGTTEQRTARLADGEEFRCSIDLFDAERDDYPYADGTFDTVLACEIFEHLAHDPMHLLLESRRVLADEGTLLLTTPNSVSLACVARALTGAATPQVFSKFPNPRKGERCGPHVREYAPAELASLLEAAGFDVELMLTEPIGPPEERSWTRELLARNGFEGSLRGEQIYCLARKNPARQTERYPEAIYE